MTTEDSITPESKSRIEEAIRLAENGTSCELRVHLENKCPEDVMDRAAFIFAELDMHKTRFRNGVVIYIALEDRKVAILGDAGINECMEPNSWEHIRNRMIHYFKENNLEAGIIEAIKLVGEKIQHFFPIQKDDRNELPNIVTTGKIRRNNE